MVKPYQYGTPIFIIPKKEGTLRFITDYFRLNQKPCRKPYKLSIIGKKIQQLEGFQYEIALDINMGYYTIIIFSTSQEITTIVTEFRKFRYNCLPMGMCASGDIFQSKVDNMLSDINFVKTYINDILVLSKDIISNNIEQLRIIYCILLSSGLKVNATRCSFGLKDIT